MVGSNVSPSLLVDPVMTICAFALTLADGSSKGKSKAANSPATQQLDDAATFLTLPLHLKDGDGSIPKPVT